jgi:putative SOS response-associated peptidase YedK
MCTNYVAVRRSRYQERFHVAPPDGEWRDEVYQDYPAPIIRRGEDGGPESVIATFSMVPRKRIPPGFKPYDTMNARVETIAVKRSFSKPWQTCQLCLIPMEGFYEPRYENGDDTRSMRWRIGLTSGEPFALTGLWRAWEEPGGNESYSFTMCTLNADQHPLLRLLHKNKEKDGTPKEKRGVVILHPDHCEDWLSCKDPEIARSFLRLFPAERMSAEAAPKPPRPSGEPIVDRADGTGSLF